MNYSAIALATCALSLFALSPNSLAQIGHETPLN